MKTKKNAQSERSFLYHGLKEETDDRCCKQADESRTVDELESESCHLVPTFIVETFDRTGDDADTAEVRK